MRFFICGLLLSIGIIIIYRTMIMSKFYRGLDRYMEERGLEEVEVKEYLYYLLSKI